VTGAGGWLPVAGSYGLQCVLNTDGDGVALNLLLNLFRIDDSGRHHVTTALPIRYIRAPNVARVSFSCPASMVQAEPVLSEVEGTFANMFNQQVTFTIAGRVTSEGFEVTAAPVYQWPWSGGVTPRESLPSGRPPRGGARG
jgi:hypothetical protein